MTMQSLHSPVAWPGIGSVVLGIPAVGALNLLDAAGEYSALVVNAREAMTISISGFTHRPVRLVSSPPGSKP